MRKLLPLLLLVLALALAACGDDDDDGGDTAAGGETTEQTTTEEQAAGGDCKQVESPQPKEDGGQKRPSEALDSSKTYAVTVKTNCGDFTFEIDQETAPKTGASFVALAEADFYDGTIFHRIVPGFVIQGGDPTGTGTGGPGYKTRDKPPDDAKYTKGVVAMAKAGTEAPGTSGSQFFVVTGDDIGLPAEYAVLGKVTDGQDVVDTIGTLGDPNTEQPTQAVVVDDVSVESS
jgi:peptidyl-prolyl cis-trans isomerase B (cyclophilin B)